MPSSSCTWLKLLSVLSAHRVLGAEWPGKAAFPNIDYIARGYNIFLGNPMATGDVGVDPGFQSYPLYNLKYSGRTTGDNKYLLPDGFEAVSNYGCALDFSSHEFYTSQSYSEYLYSSVTTGFRIPLIARFQATHDWSQFQKKTKTDDQKMVHTSADCVVYDASVDPVSTPTLSDDFKGFIRKLPMEYGDGSAYFDFFDTYGTHSLQKAKMGSRFGFSAYMDEKSWTNMERTHTDVKTLASVFGFFKATNQGKTTQDVQIFKENVHDYSEMNLGAKPVRGGDAEKWAAQVVTSPMPISYTLNVICEAVKAAGVFLSAAHATQIYNNCYHSLNTTEYCTKRLVKEKKLIETCHAINDIECLWDGDCKKGVCVNNKCDAGHQTIAYRPNNKLCFHLEGDNTLALQNCNPGDANQQWIFNSGEYQNYMQIQHAADTNMCLDAGAMTPGTPLMVTHCNGSPSQTWAREIYMGSIYDPNGPALGNVCIDAGSGVAAGKKLMMWGCNVLPQQQFDLLRHKSSNANVTIMI